MRQYFYPQGIFLHVVPDVCFRMLKLRKMWIFGGVSDKLRNTDIFQTAVFESLCTILTVATERLIQ